MAFQNHDLIYLRLMPAYKAYPSHHIKIEYKGIAY